MRTRQASHHGFRISGKPVVPLTDDQQLHNLSDSVELPRIYGPPRLFAIARDPYTIFAYWNIDWLSIFKDGEPADRQVHLRVCCADGLEEKSVAVEPMAGMHYITMSRRHPSCRIEIGYYQPADVWRSVATSNEIMMPTDEISEAEQADLATIPFHVAFHQLVDLFGAAKGEALAMVISRFQTQVLSGKENSEWGPKEKKILGQGRIALSEIADARRAFDEIDSKKLGKRTEALRGLGPISSSQAFKEDWAVVGS
jgi:Domain of unknown function (DUF4912)